MNDIDRLNDMLHTEMMNQSMYNKYMIEIQNPEMRQMIAQLRDGKMQQITQLQQEIKKMMSSQ
ncbi:MAG: spore coat protein [Clostridia bacterium]